RLRRIGVSFRAVQNGRDYPYPFIVWRARRYEAQHVADGLDSRRRGVSVRARAVLLYQKIEKPLRGGFDGVHGKPVVKAVGAETGPAWGDGDVLPDCANVDARRQPVRAATDV